MQKTLISSVLPIPLILGLLIFVPQNLLRSHSMLLHTSPPTNVLQSVTAPCNDTAKSTKFDFSAPGRCVILPGSWYEQSCRLHVANELATPHVGRHCSVTRMRVWLQLHGFLQRCKKKSKNGVSAFWIELMMANSMEVVSRLSDFRSCSYAALQHLATSCNICNILENLQSGVFRPAESIPDESRAPFLVVSQ